MASTAKPTLESAGNGSNKSAVGPGVRKNWLHSADGFLTSVLKAARAIITEMGKTAYLEHGITDDYVRSTHDVNGQPLWFGRLVMWPEGFQHRQFELTRFSLEHKIRKARDEALYRMGVFK